MVSCNISDRNIVEYEKFPNEYSLLADSISTNAVYDNGFMNIVDSMLIISSNKADTMMHFYSTPTLDYKYGVGIKGHGPNEIQSFPTFCRSTTNYLYVRGYTTNTIRKFTCSDKNLIDKGCLKISLNEPPNDMHIINDTLLYYNDLTNMEVKSYNMQNGKIRNRLVLSDLYKPNCKDVLMGLFCTNDSVAVYAFQYKREILVFKTNDLSYIKTIKWNYKNQDGLVEKQFLRCKLFYTDGVATTNCIYLLYRGVTPNEKNPHFAIEVYDNKMNPICKYKLDRKVFKFAVDEKNGYIYAMGENNDYIYRYKMVI